MLTTVDFVAAGATLALALLGAYIAVRPPKEKYHWYWFAAFIMAGLIVTGSNL